MKTAQLKIVKVAETKFVLTDSEGAPWSAWVTDSGHDASTVAEFAGRSCYQSWLKPNPATATNEGYIRHILELQHYSVLEHAGFAVMLTGVSRACCYDTQTEVLTSEGWKFWPKVRGDEWFATLNPLTNVLEYQRATEHYIGEYAGPMYRVESEQVDLLVTPNHRMWVQKVDTQTCKRGEEPFRILEAQSLLGKRVRYQKSALWVGVGPEQITVPAVTRSFVMTNPTRHAVQEYGPVSFPSRPFARFLGYYLAEGSSCNGTITLTQNPGDVRDKMQKTIQEMGLRAYPPGETNALQTKCAPLYDFLIGLGKSTAKIVPDFVETWSPDLIREFLGAVIEGDGSTHTSNGHQVIYTTSKAMADTLQVLCIKAGYSANIRVDDRVGLKRTLATSGLTFYNLRPCYIVSILKESRLFPHVNHNRADPIPNRWRNRNGDNDEMVDYRGTIHCVKVPNGLLFVRRNGKPVVSGNTHELVRHRHLSFSQLSQRFVNEDEAPFVVPPLFREEPEATAVFEELYARTRDAYRRLVEIGTRKLVAMDDKTLRRKRVREAARAVLPNMTETHMVMSGNHRAWREFFEKRGELHVDAEMREVALTIFKQVAQPLAPAIYKDFRVTCHQLATGEAVEVLERNPEFLAETPANPQR